MSLDERLLAVALARREELETAQDEVERRRGMFNRSIRHLFVDGGSLREIAEALGLSHQRVHQIVESADPVAADQTEVGDDLLVCSFCGRTQQQVAKLIAGPGVYICGGCVAETRATGGAFHRVADEGATCGFCGKHRRKLDWVVQRPDGTQPSICNECVGLCDEILAEEERD